MDDVNRVFSTPFGDSPPFTLLRISGGGSVLACRMHGWRGGVSRRAASQQVFWVFRQAGVRRILAEGGVGTIHADQAPGTLVVPDDYLDWSCRRDTALTDDYLLVMRDPLCPTLRRHLVSTARSSFPGTPVIDGGVYAVTDGRHFESRAEVRALALLGADVIGQSLAPEVYLAREIGACYAGIHQVVNRAEGVGQDWTHEELKDIFHGRASAMRDLLLQALMALPPRDGCDCRSLRKETLIRPADRESP
jgi:5'-methylthioadenosine phosphorylase